MLIREQSILEMIPLQRFLHFWVLLFISYGVRNHPNGVDRVIAFPEYIIMSDRLKSYTFGSQVESK